MHTLFKFCATFFGRQPRYRAHGQDRANGVAWPPPPPPLHRRHAATVTAPPRLPVPPGPPTRDGRVSHLREPRDHDVDLAISKSKGRAFPTS